MVLNENEKWESASVISISPEIEISYEDHQLSNESPSSSLSHSYFNHQPSKEFPDLNVSESTINISPISTRTQEFAIDHQFRNYNISWDKFPQYIMDILTKGEKLNYGDTTKVVHCICSELRLISNNISRTVFKNIVKELCSKYPTSFLQYDLDGNVIDYNNSHLIVRFVNHNNYENRPPKKTLFKITKTLNERAQLKPMENSCTNWQPNKYHEGEDEKSCKEKQEYLKKINKNYKNTEFEDITQKMIKTFAAQRNFINNLKNKKYDKIVLEWPFLFDSAILIEHFKLLTSISVENYHTNFAKRNERIFAFFKASKNKELQVFSKSNEFEVMKMIALYFKEDIEYLCKVIEVIF